MKPKSTFLDDSKIENTLHRSLHSYLYLTIIILNNLMANNAKNGLDKEVSLKNALPTVMHFHTIVIFVERSEDKSVFLRFSHLIKKRRIFSCWPKWTKDNNCSWSDNSNRGSRFKARRAGNI
jgi:hypothetical protein